MIQNGKLATFASGRKSPKYTDRFSSEGVSDLEGAPNICTPHMGPLSDHVEGMMLFWELVHTEWPKTLKRY